MRMLLTFPLCYKKKALIFAVHKLNIAMHQARTVTPVGDMVPREYGQLFKHAIFYESAETFSILCVIISGENDKRYLARI